MSRQPAVVQEPSGSAPWWDTGLPYARMRAQWAIAIVVAGLSAALTLAVGWSYWTTTPLTAVFVTGTTAGLAFLGCLLGLNQPSPRTGISLVVASLWNGLSWGSSWNTGIGPFVGELSISFFYLFLGYGILLGGKDRLRTRVARWWMVEALLILIVLNLTYLSVSEPSQIGYDGRDIWWPHLASWSSDQVDVLLRLTGCSYIVLGATFLAVLYLNSSTLHWTERRFAGPVIGLCGLFAVSAAVLQFPTMQVGVDLSQILAGRTYQGVSAIILPVAYFGSTLRGEWETGTAAARMIRTLGASGVGSVEDALRTFLRCPDLRLWVRLPDSQVLINAADRVTTVPAMLADDATPTVPVRDEKGDVIALVTVPDAGIANSRLTQAAVDACIPAIRAAQLQSEAIERVRSEQRRLLEAEQKGRRSLATDLHDGVQQDLAAVRIDLDRLTRLPTLESVHEQARESSEQLRQVIERVRGITRDLYPSALLERGLSGALEDHLVTCGRPALLDVTDAPMDPTVQLTLYYALCEVISNASKYAGAESIRITVRTDDGLVRAEVSDDGSGQARIVLGGGLFHVRERIVALRGTFDLLAVPGQGSTVQLSLPAHTMMST